MWTPSCGPFAASLQPRPARSYTQTLVCLGRRPAQSNQGLRRRRRHLVPGRPSGCRSRCRAGAADVHRCQSALWAWVGPDVERLPDRLVAAAHRGHQQHRQCGVQQPAGAAARQLPTDPQEHPHDEPQQDWRPHPAGHGVYGGRPAQCREAGQPHERGRRRGPPRGRGGRMRTSGRAPPVQHPHRRPAASGSPSRLASRRTRKRPSKWSPVVAPVASRLNTSLPVSMPYGERSIKCHGARRSAA
jgi:hypothetical protein